MVRWVEVQPDLTGRFSREMDHAQSAGNKVPFANCFINRNGRKPRYLIRTVRESGTAREGEAMQEGEAVREARGAGRGRSG